MSALWSIIVTFWMNLPWIAIALMAVFAWLRQKDSKALIMQALGAVGYFALVIGEWLVLWLLGLTGASYNIQHAAGIIFDFCCLSRWRSSPPATALKNCAAAATHLP